ncbi:hypothetical protein scyTo_0012124 [Scyliorhinus torazame]|uniref:EGF-like domain-containing protein n=1 Tax=Scyliorhinus torazame TaxID=75743 RepID=A0A401P2E6_SCYTO|nr:hypothetical protein [Scyliorhinus torazame]
MDRCCQNMFLLFLFIVLISGFVERLTICLYGGQKLAEGQRALKANCRECRNRTMAIVHETCPTLDCPLIEHIQPENRCCNVCRGHDFCAEGHPCGENSECWNLNTKAVCVCKNGFTPIQGDAAHCEGLLKTNSQNVSLTGIYSPFPAALAVGVMLSSRMQLTSVTYE